MTPPDPTHDPDDAQVDAMAALLGPLADAPDAPLDLDGLIAYHQGALDPEAAAAVEARLAVDPEARAYLADLGAPPSPFLDRWAIRSLSPRRPGKTIGVVTLLAMAAAVALFVIRPPAPDTPPAYGVQLIRGAEAETRSEGPDPSAARYRVDDEVALTLTLAPLEQLTDDRVAALRARAFVDGPDGRLSPAATQGELGGGGAWRIKARARDLFGDRYGPRALYVGFAYADAPLDAAAGAALPEGEPPDGELRWRRVPFEYRPSASP